MQVIVVLKSLWLTWRMLFKRALGDGNASKIYRKYRQCYKHQFYLHFCQLFHTTFTCRQIPLISKLERKPTTEKKIFFYIWFNIGTVLNGFLERNKTEVCLKILLVVTYICWLIYNCKEDTQHIFNSIFIYINTFLLCYNLLYEIAPHTHKFYDPFKKSTNNVLITKILLCAIYILHLGHPHTAAHSARLPRHHHSSQEHTNTTTAFWSWLVVIKLVSLFSTQIDYVQLCGNDKYTSILLKDFTISNQLLLNNACSFHLNTINTRLFPFHEYKK